MCRLILSFAGDVPPPGQSCLASLEYGSSVHIRVYLSLSLSIYKRMDCLAGRRVRRKESPFFSRQSILANYMPVRVAASVSLLSAQ